MVADQEDQAELLLVAPFLALAVLGVRNFLRLRSDFCRIEREDLIFRQAIDSGLEPENRGIYTQSDSSKKSSRNIWSLAVVSVDQRY